MSASLGCRNGDVGNIEIINAPMIESHKLPKYLVLSACRNGVAREFDRCQPQLEIVEVLLGCPHQVLFSPPNVKIVFADRAPIVGAAVKCASLYCESPRLEVIREKIEKEVFGQ